MVGSVAQLVFENVEGDFIGGGDLSGCLVGLAGNSGAAILVLIFGVIICKES